jgi:hypothetical protein
MGHAEKNGTPARCGGWRSGDAVKQEEEAFELVKFYVDRMHAGEHNVFRQSPDPDDPDRVTSRYVRRKERPVTDYLIREHLTGKPDAALGLRPVRPGEATSSVLIFDIDNHPDKSGALLPPEEIDAAALLLARACRQHGLYPAAFISGGGKGYHLWSHWDTPQSVVDLRALARSILAEIGYAEGKGGVVEKRIEIFPQQASIPTEKNPGGLVALPLGRNSMAVRLDLEAGEIEYLPSAPLLTSSQAVPKAPEEPAEDAETARAEAAFRAEPRNLPLIAELLMTYVDAEDTATWNTVGYALKHDFDTEEGKEVFRKYSMKCPEKFARLRSFDRQWESMTPRTDRPATSASIFYLAAKAGWSGPGPYEAKNGGIYWNRRGENGEVKSSKLTNFVANIVEDITLDDGSGVVQRVYLIDTPHGQARVEAEDFLSLTWVDQVLGARAIITPGATLRGHAAVAIKTLSKPVARTIYRHVGWRWIGGEMLFLHAGGAIGANGPVTGIEVDPESPNLANYRLPAPGNVKAAVRASLDLVKLATDRRITWALLAATYRAPLGEFCPVTFSVNLYGGTGERKTSLVLLFLTHFGPFTRAPAEWESTANALERGAFAAKDVTFPIDDFSPKTNGQDQLQLNSKGERVLRSAANRSGRGRLTAKCTFQPILYPRGLIVVTGEDLPTGESLRARIVIVPVAKGTIPITDELSAAQANARTGIYAHAMAGYVQWLAGQETTLGATLAARQEKLRSEARGTHSRTPENVAGLMLGAEKFLEFAVHAGAITAEKAEEHQKAAWQVLQGQGAVQMGLMDAEKPTKHFIELLQAVINSGKGHIAHQNSGGVPRGWPAALGWRYRDVKTGDGGAEGGVKGQWDPRGITIGWLGDKMNLYLEPRAAFAEVQRMAQDEGKKLPWTATTLWKQLREAKMLKGREKDRLTRKVTIMGKQMDVLHVDAHHMLGLAKKDQ